MILVADTSSLVSLGAVADQNPSPLALLLDHYEVAVPQQVVDELKRIVRKSTTDREAAKAVLDMKDEFDIHKIDSDSALPFDEGENAAISLAEELGAGYFLCDEFRNVSQIHGSLGDVRLVTTPNFLKVLFKRDDLTNQQATDLLEQMTEARNWNGNSYVDHARKWFEARS